MKKFNKILNLFYIFLGYIICKLVYKRKKGGIYLTNKDYKYKIKNKYKNNISYRRKLFYFIFQNIAQNQSFVQIEVGEKYKVALQVPLS